MIRVQLSTMFKKKVIEKYMEDSSLIYKIISIKIGSSQKTIFLYNLQKLNSEKKKLSEHFYESSLLITQDDQIEDAKKVYLENENLKCIIKYDFDYNTFKIIEGRNESIIEEKEWNNNIVGLYCINSVISYENNFNLENFFKDYFNNYEFIKVNGFDNYFKIKKECEIEDLKNKDFIDMWKGVKKYSMRKDNCGNLNEYNYFQINLFSKFQKSNLQSKILDIKPKKNYFDFLRFVFIDDLIMNYPKTISWFLKEIQKTSNFQNKVLLNENNVFLNLNETKISKNTLAYKFKKKIHFHSSKLRNVHFGICHQTNLQKYLVKPDYIYFHYNQDNFKDEGWGCAYRSLQTLLSWQYLNKSYDKKIPTIPEIQQILVDLGDKQKDFVNSKNWIGSIEVSYVIQKLTNVDSSILYFKSGAEVLNHLPVLKHHFETFGGPIMIGGGVLAYTLLGVAEDQEKPEKSQFLILDPHYKGKEDLKMITNPKQKAVYWTSHKIFKASHFYNLCCPQN